MTVTYVGAGTLASSSLGVFTRPAAVANRTMMVVTAHSTGGNVITKPAGWYTVAEIVSSTRVIYVYAKWVETASSEPGSYTFTDCQRATMLILGGTTRNPIELFTSFEIAGKSTTTTDYQLTLASQTATKNDQLLIGGLYVGSNTSGTLISLPSGWTQRASVTGTASTYAGTNAAPASGSSTGTQTFTGNNGSASNLMVAWMGLVRPADEVTYEGRDTSASTATVDKPTGLQDGDLLVVHATNIASTTPTVPSGWSTIKSTSSGVLRLLTLAKKVTDAASEPATYTFTNSTGTSIVNLRNQHAESATTAFQTVNTGTAAAGSDTTISSQTISNNGSLVLLAGVQELTRNTTALTNWTDTGVYTRGNVYRRSYDYTTTASVTWNVGSGVELVHWVPVIPAVSIAVPAATPTTTVAALAPTVTGGATLAAALATATADDIAPAIVVSQVALAEVALGTAEALAPAIVVSQSVEAVSSLATISGLEPTASGSAIANAVIATASGELLEPLITVPILAPVAVATAEALIASLIYHGFVPAETAEMAMVAISPEAGTIKFPVQWSGGAATIERVAMTASGMAKAGVGVGAAQNNGARANAVRGSGVGGSVSGGTTSGSVTRREN